MAELVIAIRAQNQAQAALNSVKGSIGQIQTAAANASAQMRQMGDSLKSMGGKMTLGVTAPILGFAGAALKGAMANEQLEVSFTTMLGSAEKAKKMMAELSKFAASTPFETPEIQNASKMLLAFGVEAENIIPTMTQLGDIASGLNIPLGDLAYLFGTTRAAGRLMTADLNQFTSRGIPMIAALAKTLGIAESEVKAFVEAGKVGFPEVQAALASLTSEGGQFAGLMAAQSQTLAGLLSTFRDNIGLALTAIGKQLIESFDLKGVLTNFNTQLEKVSKAVINFAQTQPKLFRLIAVFVGIAAALGPLLIGLGILMTSLAPLAPTLIAIAGAFSVLIGPIGLVAAALVALVAWDVGGIRTKITGVVDSLKEWLGVSAQVESQSIKMGASVNRMSPAMQDLQSAITPVISAWDKWRDAVARAENAMGRMQGAVQTERFVQLPDPSMIDRVAQAFVRVRDALADFISTGDTAGIQAIFNSIRSAVANLDLPSISEVWELAKVEITTFVKNFTWDVPGDVFNGLKTAVMDQLRSIWDNLFGGGGGPLKGVDSRNLPDFGMRAESIFAGALKGIESAEGVDKKTLFSPLVDFVMGQLTTIDWSAALGGIGKGATNLFVGVKDFVLSQLTAIDWSTLASGAVEGAGNLFDGVKGFVTTQMATIDWSTLGGIGKGAQDFFAPLTSWVSEQLAGIDWAALPGETLTKLQTGATTLKDAVVGAITTFDFSIDPAKTAELSTLLDSVRPVFDKIFGPEGIVTTVNAMINESMIAVGERLNQTNGEEIGRQFSLGLSQLLGVFTLFEGMKLEGQAERLSAVATLGTDILNFLSDFVSGMDAEALATSLGGSMKVITDILAAPIDAEKLQALGASASKFVGNVLSKIGEVLGTPGFGADVGEGVGKTAGALAKGAMALATGIVTELGKINWAELSANLDTFVTGFVTGVSAGIAEADFGPIAQALWTKIWDSLTTVEVPDNPFLDLANKGMGSVGDAWLEVGTRIGEKFKESLADFEIKAPAWIEKIGSWFSGSALKDAMNASILTGAGGAENLLSSFQSAPSWLSSFKWPELPAFAWPELPAFAWPSLPLFKWPTLPKWTWPEIHAPGWLSDLLNFNPFGGSEPAANAVGTSNFRGGLTWVGETGPELVAVPRGSRIFSNSESEEMMGGGEQLIIHIENMNVRSDTDIHAIAYQIDDLRRRRRPRRS